jgi:hypothetical protein
MPAGLQQRLRSGGYSGCPHGAALSGVVRGWVRIAPGPLTYLIPRFVICWRAERTSWRKS